MASGLQTLAENSTLEQVEVLHTASTDAGIKRIQQAKPGCDVNTVFRDALTRQGSSQIPHDPR